ncbi:MAG: helix-turn-helix domain-containing protein [Kiritimatiellae bacterium]|nr:helix-turn-helix domain-containing protein [Kiritimatiellia bacterium]MBR0197901.1 helix-turn-helix domain-containing protein [Kiritimatiellia bacterium]
MALEQLIQALLTATPARRREVEAVLKGRSSVAAAKADADRRLVTISGAARLLGVGRNTVYRLIKAGRLETVRLNGVSRVPMRSIDAMVDGMEQV